MHSIPPVPLLPSWLHDPITHRWDQPSDVFALQRTVARFVTSSSPPPSNTTGYDVWFGVIVDAEKQPLTVRFSVPHTLWKAGVSIDDINQILKFSRTFGEGQSYPDIIDDTQRIARRYGQVSLSDSNSTISLPTLFHLSLFIRT